MSNAVKKVIYGAKVQTCKTVNPRAVLMDAVNSGIYPLTQDGREACELQMFLDNYGNKDFMRTVFAYWHANNWHALVSDKNNKVIDVQKLDYHKEKIQEKVSMREAAKEDIRNLTKKYLTISLQSVMPNGKSLRECTGEEVRKIDGFYKTVLARVIQKVKPNELVGDVLTDNDLQRMGQ